MNKDIGIPAASLADIDLDKIRLTHPEIADELTQLGSLLARGVDTDTDFLRICQLLLRSGERQKAKALLLANCEVGDSAYELFKAEFADMEEAFAASIASFSQQFQCDLQLVRQARHLSSVYSCHTRRTNEEDDIAAILMDSAGCEVQVTYHVDGLITADLYSLSEPCHAISLEFDGSKWRTHTLE
jgi:hypothetical protein